MAGTSAGTVQGLSAVRASALGAGPHIKRPGCASRSGRSTWWACACRSTARDGSSRVSARVERRPQSVGLRPGLP